MFLKYLQEVQRKLIDGFFRNLEIFYSDNSHDSVEKCFYDSNKVYIEFINQKVSVIIKNSYLNRSEISKTKLSDKFISSFIKEDYGGFLNVKDVSLKEFHEQYILVPRILALDYEEIEFYGNSLKRTEIKEKSRFLEPDEIDNIDFESLYLLFIFLKDSVYLKKMAEHVYLALNSNEMHLFIKLLNKLKINGNCILTLTERAGNTIQHHYAGISSSFFVLMADLIKNLQPMMCEPEYYKLLLYFFYKYMKTVDEVNIGTALTFIRESFWNKKFKEDGNMIPLKRLAQYICFIKDLKTTSFVFDIDNGRNERKVDLLSKESYSEEY